MSTSATAVDATRLFVALGRVNRAVRRDAPGELGHGALSALSALAVGGPQRLGALACVEGVTAPSMTRIVASLEDQGLVRRTPDPEDGRAALISATDEGVTLVTAGKDERLAALAARIERLAEADRDALEQALPALERLAEDPA